MTMLDTSTAVYAATRQSWTDHNYRELLKHILTYNPNIDRAESFAFFLEAISKPVNKRYRQSALEYAHDNAYDALTRIQRLPAKEVRAERAATVQATAHRIVEAAKSLVMLDLLLPTGKTLRESTGKDCTKAGGWFSKLARKVRPNQIVGRVLSEAEVRKLFKE